MRGGGLAEPRLDELYPLLSRSKSKSYRADLRTVIRLTKERQLEMAYHIVKESLRAGLHDVFYHYLAGRLSRAYGDLALAKSHFTQALYGTSKVLTLNRHRGRAKIENTSSTPLQFIRYSVVSLINLLIQCKQYDELHTLIKWRLSVDEHPELYYALGWLEEKSGRADKAREAYQNALCLDEQAHQCRLALVRLLLKHSSSDVVDQHLQVLRRELPRDDLVWCLSGELAFSRGETRVGKKALQRALKYNKRSSFAYRLLGDHYAEKKPKRALRYYERSQRGDTPNNDLYHKLAVIYERLQRYEDAIGQLSLLRYFITAEEQPALQRRIRALQKRQERSFSEHQTYQTQLSAWLRSLFSSRR